MRSKSASKIKAKVDNVALLEDHKFTMDEEDLSLHGAISNIESRFEDDDNLIEDSVHDDVLPSPAGWFTNCFFFLLIFI